MGVLAHNNNDKLEIAGFDVEVRPHARARRLTLRFDPLSGTFRVSCPPRTPLTEITRFVMRHQAWAAKQMAKAPEVPTVEPGVTMPFKGAEVTCVRDPALRGMVRLLDNQILVPGAPESFTRRLKDFLKTEARQSFQVDLDRYAAQLKKIRPDARKRGRLTVRDTTSRWGSCAHNGNISLSWRLIMAPPHVASYVIAHEVAHLAEPNHSAAFWQVCTDLYGPTQQPQAWLKQYGARLFHILP